MGMITYTKGVMKVETIERIKERAKKDIQTIVLPESLDPRILEATEQILKEKVANIILIGKENEIMDKAGSLDISGATIIDPDNFDQMDDYIASLVELRSEKGMTKEEARELLTKDPLYLGVMMVEEGMAGGVVSGAINPTPNVLRPALQILRTAPGRKFVSAFFLMVVPDCEYGADGTFIFADSGLVQNPTSEELAIIAGSSARSFKLLVEEKPVVGMLSHSTMGSAQHEHVDKVTEAIRLSKEWYPEYAIDGELQLDAAIDPKIGQVKSPGHEVAGKVNVLIFPDLDAGNIGYKLTQYLAKAQAYGPITQGISKPANDLSRGCSTIDIIGVVAITAVQAINIARQKLQDK